MRLTLLPVAALLICSTACNDVSNQTPTDGDTVELREMADGMQEDVKNYREEDFTTDMLEANAEALAWVHEGIAKGTDGALKEQAKNMLADHEQLHNSFLAYAQKHNYDLTGTDTNRTVNNRKPAGTKWDEEWSDEVADLQRTIVRRFQRAVKQVKEPELSSIISQTLPKLRLNLQMVEALDERLGK